MPYTVSANKLSTHVCNGEEIRYTRRLPAAKFLIGVDLILKEIAAVATPTILLPYSLFPQLGKLVRLIQHLRKPASRLHCLWCCGHFILVSSAIESDQLSLAGAIRTDAHG